MELISVASELTRTGAHPRSKILGFFKLGRMKEYSIFEVCSITYT